MAAKKIKTKTITLRQESGAFTSFFGSKKVETAEQNPEITKLRSMFSNEKARLLHVLKAKQPNSLYELAKILGRDFKSVRADIKLLEELGFVEMIPIHKGGRERLKPLLVIDELNVTIQI
jgi:predicted transcriptional regulator